MIVTALELWAWATAWFVGLGALAFGLLRAAGSADPSFGRRYALQGLLLIIALVPAWFGPQAFGFGLATYACIAAHEVSSVLTHVARFARPLRWVGALSPALACLVLVSVVQPAPPLVPLALGILGFGLPWLLYRARGRLRGPAAALVCSLWPGVALAGMALLGTRRTLALDIAFLYGVLEVSGTAAYVFGRTLGRRKVWPRLSPDTTWEGLLGGLVAAGLMGWVLSFTLPGLPRRLCALLGVGLAALGTCGHWSAAAVKRAARAKDFGTWLGPHGGFVDAYDSFVLVAPLWCALLSVLG